jgi:hypothetical protein
MLRRRTADESRIAPMANPPNHGVQVVARRAPTSSVDYLVLLFLAMLFAMMALHLG